MSLQREKIAKLSAILDAKDPHEIYLRLVSLWQNPSEIVLNSRELPTLALNAGSRPTFSDSASTQQFLDQRTYLPDDILTKVDRASMAVGLESRVPFLDPRVIALSWRLTSEQKFRNGKGKWLLRQVLSEFVPLELFDRPKTGFGVPIGSWLRGPLVDWAENLLSEKRLKSEGYFDVKAVRSVWENHRSGKKDGHYPLWAVLMFQAWKGSV
jgi:asparagine synthase (glutamine-hydrolysing)